MKIECEELSSRTRLKKKDHVFRSRSYAVVFQMGRLFKRDPSTGRPINFAQPMHRVLFCITNQGGISSVGQSGRQSRKRGAKGICEETRSIRKLVLLRPPTELSAQRILPLSEAVKVDYVGLSFAFFALICS